MKEPIFLTLAEVIEIQLNQIELYGGQAGVRDLNLLQSAIAQPEASFGGVFLHADLFEMAAAYAFHLCQNHPFFDGNKRAALAASLVFLEINGISIHDPKMKLFEPMILMASGKLSKPEFSQVLRSLCR